MVSFIRNVSFDCADPYALAGFWSAVVGHPVDPDFGPGDTIGSTSTSASVERSAPRLSPG